MRLNSFLMYKKIPLYNATTGVLVGMETVTQWLVTVALLPSVMSLNATLVTTCTPPYAHLYLVEQAIVW